MKNQDRAHRKGGKKSAVPQGETAPQSAPKTPRSKLLGEDLCGFDDADFRSCTLYKIDSQHFIVERWGAESKQFEHAPLTRSAARKLLVESVIPEEFRADVSFPHKELLELETAHTVALAIILRRCESLAYPAEAWTDDELKQSADAGECVMANDAMDRLRKAFNDVWVACGGRPDSAVEGGAR